MRASMQEPQSTRSSWTRMKMIRCFYVPWVTSSSRVRQHESGGKVSRV